MHIPDSGAQGSSGEHQAAGKHHAAGAHSTGTHHSAEGHQSHQGYRDSYKHHDDPRHHKDHGCGRTPISCREGFTLARAYVAHQQLERVFAPSDALWHGTLFPELVRPYP